MKDNLKSHRTEASIEAECKPFYLVGWPGMLRELMVKDLEGFDDLRLLNVEATVYDNYFQLENDNPMNETFDSAAGAQEWLDEMDDYRMASWGPVEITRTSIRDSIYDILTVDMMVKSSNEVS